jgi:hypothetical protein
LTTERPARVEMISAQIEPDGGVQPGEAGVVHPGLT